MDSKCNGTNDWVRLKTNLLRVRKEVVMKDRGENCEAKKVIKSCSCNSGSDI